MDTITPHLSFGGIERIVRHDELRHIRECEDVIHVRENIGFRKILTSFAQILRCRIEPQRRHHRNDAARRLRNRRVLYEKRVPDQICLLLLGEAPVGVRSHVRVPQHLGDQVVIAHELIDAPEA